MYLFVCRSAGDVILLINLQRLDKEDHSKMVVQQFAKMGKEDSDLNVMKTRLQRSVWIVIVVIIC